MAKITVSNGEEEFTFESKKEMLIQIGREILEQSQEPMTLRQLYYRFVALDLIENKQSQYQYLGQAVKEARIEGRIPWGLIEDRTRSTDSGDYNNGEYIHPDNRFENNLQWFKNTPNRFRRPRWQYQPVYCEVWVEKEALAGLFKNVCDDLGVVSFPNRGYTSITTLHEAAQRIKEQTRKKVPPMGEYRKAHILYFGDFDPSGKDIERNIRDKLRDTFHVRVNVHRIGLTREQIDEFELPPQPAKKTDARYESFVEKHGDMAVELDALPPDELRSLIRSSVNKYFDESIYKNRVKPKEEEEKEYLQEQVDQAMNSE